MLENLTAEYIEKLDKRMLSKIKIPSDLYNNCWEWIGAKHKTGYGSICVGKRVERPHRVAYALLHGKIPADRVIMHSCDNPACINVYHLSLGTRQDNVNDKVNKGRQHRKLTATQVLLMRQEYSEGKCTLLELATKYGVCSTQVGRIIARTRWTHI